MRPTVLFAVLFALLVALPLDVGAAPAPASRAPRISATIGSSSNRPDVLRRMVRGGMDVARLDLRYGTGRQVRRSVRQIRAAASAERRPVALVMDLPGPRVRLGTLPEGPRTVRAREAVTLSVRRTPGAGEIPVRRAALVREVAVGDALLLEEGRVHLTVTSVDARAGRIHTRVSRGGVVGSRSDVAIRGQELARPTVEPADKLRLAQIAEAKPEMVWVSFATRGDQVRAVRGMLAERGVRPQLFAKIETRSAIANIDEILRASDGIVIAWGDLQAMIPRSERPAIDAFLIRKAHEHGKPIIPHTDYLDGMRSSPAPSARNVRDLRRLVRLGADYIGLNETGKGRYPVEAVAAAAAIARQGGGRAR